MEETDSLNLLDSNYLTLIDSYVRSTLEGCDQSNYKERILVDDFRLLLADLNESAKTYGPDSNGYIISPDTGLKVPWTLSVKNKSELNKLGNLSQCARQFKWKCERAMGKESDDDLDSFYHKFRGPITSDELEWLHRFIVTSILGAYDSSNPREQKTIDTILDNNGLTRTPDGTYVPKPKNASIKTSNGGCYVATCVYGSYDCPQVWTLRRFRDKQLSATWFGRRFISIYYAMSPGFVRRYGDIPWVRKVIKVPLDFFVMACNRLGISDGPYED